MKRSFALALILALLISMAFSSTRLRTEQIVTLDVIAPDGSRNIVKGIVGGAPITLTDVNGAQWTLYCKEIKETR